MQASTETPSIPDFPAANVRLVVCDLDGTLLNHNHKITPRTVAAVQALVAAGAQFMLATGRHYEDVYLLAKRLGVPMYLITSNGARVHNQDGHIFYENHMPAELVAQVLTLSRGFEIHRNLYKQDLWLVEEPHEELLAIHDASGFEYQLSDFSALDLSHIDKIYFTAEHAALVPLEKLLQQHFHGQLSITFTSPEYLEIMNYGVSKGRALERVLAQIGVEAQETVAMGDGMNDKEMLNLVGHRVVMDNATDAVKALIRNPVIAKSNAEEGVADYIENTLLPLLQAQHQ
ncbi:MAG: HAD family phosphatase [Gammaproteobacteria bacterium]|nr:HAD family phosphatase [Gammaproteobacteria bacterium]